ncbi:uncharacterized protein OCT59_026469 [Rhizophagus irregularis]|uniref:uncharacterized protein n=1 Tax=Rhizophagus irregularis TaxID=588596 RepID=UPI00332999F2|nr:hypothetical protein OCT59_026469 [Rhizophagus irregularis]
MQDNKDKRPLADVKILIIRTSNWIRALEKFRTDVNYQGLIEEVDTKEELEDQLCRFVHAMRKKDGSRISCFFS